jgi:peroxiredoxin
MRNRVACFLVLLFGPLVAFSGPDKSILSYEVCDVKGKCQDLSILKTNKASVIVFLQPDCPIAQKYTRTLRFMVDTLTEQGVQVIGIIPGTYYSNKDVKAFRKKYKVNFSLYFDRSSALAKRMAATISPEVFLVDPEGQVQYSGKIDNWFEALGVYRSIITKFYLNTAISNFLNGQEIAIKKTDAVGCILEY